MSLTKDSGKSSDILLEMEPLQNPGFEIQMAAVGNIEPFADTPDQGIGMGGAAGNEIGGGKIQPDGDFRNAADRIGRVDAGKEQMTVFRLEKRGFQMQCFVAESECIKQRTVCSTGGTLFN